MSTISAGTTTTTALVQTGDTTGSLVLATGSGATTALTLDSSQNASFAKAVNLPNTFGFKNRIINGGMTIDQRNGGASVTPTGGQYTLDRYETAVSQANKFTVQQNAGSVTPPAGFTNYLGVTSSSAYSINSTDFFLITQHIEGYNVADLAWGTANAKTVTLSFWVRSSLTGTFGGSLSNNGYTRTYPFSYTVSSANTWEQKTITIAGDTSGTWLTTNGRGIGVGFSLGTGTTNSGTAGSWAGSAYYSATGATSVVGTSGATFYITGVQLEVGSQATSFDFRDFGRELILCQRYFETCWNYGGSLTGAAIWDTYGGQARNFIPFRVNKRTSATITAYSYTNGASGFFGSSSGNIAFNGGGSDTNFNCYTASSFNGYIGLTWTASAEL